MIAKKNRSFTDNVSSAFQLGNILFLVGSTGSKSSSLFF